VFGPGKPKRKEKAILFTWLYGREDIDIQTGANLLIIKSQTQIAPHQF
jgi:hypothetical protein